MTIVLMRPDTARARPSSLIKDNDQYSTLFHKDYPIAIYRVCAEILKETEQYLSKRTDSLSISVRNDLKFYVALVASREAVRKVFPSPEELESLVGKPLDKALYDEAYQLVKPVYEDLGATDKVAKGPDLLKKITLSLVKKYGSS